MEGCGKRGARPSLAGGRRPGRQHRVRFRTILGFPSIAARVIAESALGIKGGRRASLAAMEEAVRPAQPDFFDPGRHAAALEVLPQDPAVLLEVVQGLLLHDHFGGLLYGPPPPGFAAASRVTLPVAARLDAVLAAEPKPLSETRAPFARQVGTCRDFALLLAAFLRAQGRPARVRCGFANYFEAGRWEDHWVCEYRNGESWIFADAQLDAAHRDHLGIAFDPAALPAGRFRPAQEIWRACKAGEIDPATCGHGEEAAGAWFLQVNLQRDCLALEDCLVSQWDAWREVPNGNRAADPRRCEQLSKDGERLA